MKTRKLHILESLLTVLLLLSFFIITGCSNQQPVEEETGEKLDEEIIVSELQEVPNDSSDYSEENTDVIPDNSDKWDGNSISEPILSNDTYEISNGSELAWISQQVEDGNTFNGYTIKLMNDIDLNNQNWLPIGYYNDTFKTANTFEGIFEGNNRIIYNLYIDGSKELSAGLFGATINAIIQNLTIENTNIVGGWGTGSFVGCFGEGSIIRDCALNGEISITKAYYYVGGLVGESCGIVENCTIEGNVKLNNAGYDSGHCIGGLAGYIFEDSIVDNCHIISDIDISTNAGGTGGFAGSVYGILENCTITGNVIANGNDVGEAGGFAGYVGGTVSNCIVKGDVVVYGVNGAGGLTLSVSEEGTVRDCVIEGNVAATGGTTVTRVGGMVGGYLRGALIDCTIKGNVAISGGWSTKAEMSGLVYGVTEEGLAVGNVAEGQIYVNNKEG